MSFSSSSSSSSSDDMRGYARRKPGRDFADDLPKAIKLSMDHPSPVGPRSLFSALRRVLVHLQSSFRRRECPVHLPLEGPDLPEEEALVREEHEVGDNYSQQCGPRPPGVGHFPGWPLQAARPAPREALP